MILTFLYSYNRNNNAFDADTQLEGVIIDFSYSSAQMSAAAVPGPVAWLWILPVLVIACCGLLAWWRRKRKDAAWGTLFLKKKKKKKKKSWNQRKLYMMKAKLLGAAALVMLLGAAPASATAPTLARGSLHLQQRPLLCVR